MDGGVPPSRSWPPAWWSSWPRPLEAWDEPGPRRLPDGPAPRWPTAPGPVPPRRPRCGCATWWPTSTPPAPCSSGSARRAPVVDEGSRRRASGGSTWPGPDRSGSPGRRRRARRPVPWPDWLGGRTGRVHHLALEVDEPGGGARGRARPTSAHRRWRRGGRRRHAGVGDRPRRQPRARPRSWCRHPAPIRGLPPRTDSLRPMADHDDNDEPTTTWRRGDDEDAPARSGASMARS